MKYFFTVWFSVYETVWLLAALKMAAVPIVGCRWSMNNTFFPALFFFSWEIYKWVAAGALSKVQCESKPNLCSGKSFCHLCPFELSNLHVLEIKKKIGFEKLLIFIIGYQSFGFRMMSSSWSQTFRCVAVLVRNRICIFLSFLKHPMSIIPLPTPNPQTLFFLGTSSLLVHMMGWVHIVKLLCLHWLGCPLFESMFSWPLGLLRQKGNTRVWWSVHVCLLPLKVWNSQSQTASSSISKAEEWLKQIDETDFIPYGLSALSSCAFASQIIHDLSLYKTLLMTLSPNIIYFSYMSGVPLNWWNIFRAYFPLFAVVETLLGMEKSFIGIRSGSPVWPGITLIL